MGYIKNVTKSLGYALPAVLQNQAQNIFAFKDLVTGASEIDPENGAVKTAMGDLNVFLKGQFGTPAKNFFKNVKTAAKTGNFYTDPKQVSDSFGFGDEFDLNSFGKDFGDEPEFNPNEEPSSGETNIDRSVTNNITVNGAGGKQLQDSVIRGAMVTTGAIIKSNSRIARQISISNAMAYQAAVSTVSMLERIANESNAYHSASLGHLGAISDGISELGDDIKALKAISLPEEVVNNRNSSRLKKITGVDYSSFDFTEYVKLIADNTKKTAENSMISLLFQSIAQAENNNELIHQISDTLFGESKLFKAMKKSDKVFGIAPMMMIRKASSKLRETGVFDWLADILDPSDLYTKELKFDEYNIKRTAFDGETKRSIVDTIPTLLSKIHNEIASANESKGIKSNNMNELIFDQEDGVMKKRSEYHQVYKDKRKTAATLSMSDVDIKGAAENLFSFSDSTQRDSFMDRVLERFAEKAFGNQSVVKESVQNISSTYTDFDARFQELINSLPVDQLVELNRSLSEYAGRMSDLNHAMVTDDIGNDITKSHYRMALREGLDLSTSKGLMAFKKKEGGPNGPNGGAGGPNGGNPSGGGPMDWIRSLFGMNPSGGGSGGAGGPNGGGSGGGIFGKMGSVLGAPFRGVGSVFDAITQYMSYKLFGGKAVNDEEPLLSKLYKSFSTSLEKLLFGSNSNEGGVFAAAGAFTRSKLSFVGKFLNDNLALPMTKWFDEEFKPTFTKFKDGIFNWFTESLVKPIKVSLGFGDSNGGSLKTFLSSSFKTVMDKVQFGLDATRDFLFGNGKTGEDARTGMIKKVYEATGLKSVVDYSAKKFSDAAKYIGDGVNNLQRYLAVKVFSKKGYLGRLGQQISDNIIVPLKETVQNIGESISEKIVKPLRIFFFDPQTGFFPKMRDTLSEQLWSPFKDTLFNDKTGVFNQEFKVKFRTTFIDPVKEFFMGDESKGKKNLFLRSIETLNTKILAPVTSWINDVFNLDKVKNTSFSKAVGGMADKYVLSPLRGFLFGSEGKKGFLEKSTDFIEQKLINPTKTFLFGDEASGNVGFLRKFEKNMKDFLFGNEEEGTKGVIDKYLKPAKEFVHREIIQPFTAAMKETVAELGDFFKEEVFKPLKESSKGIMTSFGIRINEFWKSGKELMIDAFNTTFNTFNEGFGRLLGNSNKSLTDMMKENVLTPIKDILGGFRKMAVGAIKSVVSLPVNILKHSMDQMKITDLLKGRGGHLDAAEQSRLLSVHNSNKMLKKKGWGDQINMKASSSSSAVELDENGNPKKSLFQRMRDGWTASKNSRKSAGERAVDELKNKEKQEASFKTDVKQKVMEVAETSSEFLPKISEVASNIYELLAGKFNVNPKSIKGGKRRSSNSSAEGDDVSATDTRAIQREETMYTNSNRMVDLTSKIFDGVDHLVYLMKKKTGVDELGAGGIGSGGKGYKGKRRGILGSLLGLVAAPVELLKELGTGVIRGISQTVVSALQMVVEPFVQVVRGVGNIMNSTIKLVGKLGGILQSLGNAIGAMISATASIISTGVSTVATAAGQVLNAVFTTTGTIIKSIQPMLEGVMKVVGGAVHLFGSLFLGAAKVVGSVILGGTNLFASALGKLFGFRIGGGKGRSLFGGAQKVFVTGGKIDEIHTIKDILRVYVTGGKLDEVPHPSSKGEKKLSAEAKPQSVIDAAQKATSIAGSTSNVLKLERYKENIAKGRGNIDKMRQETAIKKQQAAEAANDVKLISASQETNVHLSSIRKGFGEYLPLLAAAAGGIWTFFKTFSFAKAFGNLTGTIARFAAGLLGKKVGEDILEDVLDDAGNVITEGRQGADKKYKPRKKNLGSRIRTRARATWRQVKRSKVGRFTRNVHANVGNLSKNTVLKSAGVGLAGAGINYLADKYLEEGVKKRATRSVGTAMEWGAAGATLGSVIPGIGTAIGGAIGAVAGVVYENWDIIKNSTKSILEGVGSFFMGDEAQFDKDGNLTKAPKQGFFERFGAFFAGKDAEFDANGRVVKQQESNLAQGIKDWIFGSGGVVNEYGEVIYAGQESVIGKMKNMFVGMTDWVSSTWDTTMNWMSSAVSSTWDFISTLPQKLYDAASWVVDKWSSGIRWTFDFILNLPNQLLEIGKSAITGIVDFITNPEETLKKLTNFTTSIFDSISKGFDDFGNKASEVFGSMIYGIRTMLPTWMGGIEPDTKTVSLNGEEIQLNNKVLRQFLDGNSQTTASEVEYAKKVHQSFSEEGIIEGNWLDSQNSISDSRIAQLDAKTIKALLLSQKLGVADLDNATLEKLAAQLQKVDPSLNGLGGSIVLPVKDESVGTPTAVRSVATVPQKVFESQNMHPDQALFGKSTAMSGVKSTANGILSKMGGTVPASTGPVSDNLVVGKGVDLKNLNADTLNRLNGMADEYYAMTGERLRITSGYRSIEKQAALYNAPHTPGFVAMPGKSMHNYGLAIDIDGSNKSWSTNQASKLEKLGLLSKYSFHRPVRKEAWHVEDNTVNRSQVQSTGYALYKQGKLDSNAARIIAQTESKGEKVQMKDLNGIPEKEGVQYTQYQPSVPQSTEVAMNSNETRMANNAADFKIASSQAEAATNADAIQAAAVQSPASNASDLSDVIAYLKSIASSTSSMASNGVTAKLDIPQEVLDAQKTASTQPTEADTPIAAFFNSIFPTSVRGGNTMVARTGDVNTELRRRMEAADRIASGNA